MPRPCPGSSFAPAGQRNSATKRPDRNLPPHHCSLYPKTQGSERSPGHKTCRKWPKHRRVAQHHWSQGPKRKTNDRRLERRWVAQDEQNTDEHSDPRR